jgi:hypothetical protein
MLLFSAYFELIKLRIMIGSFKASGWDDPVASRRGYVLLAGHFAQPVRSLNS